MSADEIAATLQSWLEEKTGDAIDLDRPYAESESVDSFDVFELVRYAESTFNVRFAGSDFESPRFGTLSGLAQIIEAKSAQ